MPYMDGHSLIAFLRQNPATAAVPIIMVTTESDPAKLEAVRQLGVAVCDKSFPVGLVRGIIEGIFG
jgi:two-component system chemotaxis response regulator CheY